MVDESHHTCKNFCLGSSHVDEGVGVDIVGEDGPEEVAAAGQDQLVRLDPLFIPAHQGDISEVRPLSQLLESQGDIVLKIVPFQMKLLWGRHFLMMALLTELFA